MDPKNKEDIIKRRGKPTTSRPNALVLLFLKILNYKEEQKKNPPVEPSTLIEEKADDKQDICLFEEKENIASDSLGIILEQKEARDKQGTVFEGQEKVVQVEVTHLETTVLPEIELLKDLDENPENELADIRQRLGALEVKIATLGGILISLEGKQAHLGETQFESGLKIDLQTVLSNIDQKPDKTESVPGRYS